jgi:hypothetical protein
MYAFGGGDGKYWLNDLLIFDLCKAKFKFKRLMNGRIKLIPEEKLQRGDYSMLPLYMIRRFISSEENLTGIDNLTISSS